MPAASQPVQRRHPLVDLTLDLGDLLGEGGGRLLILSALIPKSTISEVLAGKKPLSRQLIRKLADYFGVDVSVLAANL